MVKVNTEKNLGNNLQWGIVWNVRLFKRQEFRAFQMRPH
jgi:hypothetical protein